MAPRENPSVQDTPKKPVSETERQNAYLRQLNKDKLVSSLSAYTGGTIRPGTTSKDIEKMKDALNYLGFRAGRGTYFDEQMTTAVMSFQENRGITSDGIIGPKTLQKILETLNNRESRDSNTRIIDIPTTKPEIKRANGVTFEIWNLQKGGKSTGRQVIRTSEGYLYQADFDNRGMFSTGVIFYPNGSVFEGAQMPHSPDQLYGTYLFGTPRKKFIGVLSNRMQPVEGKLFDTNGNIVGQYRSGKYTPLKK